jgi:putative hydrolase of the HAD superfamily
MNLPRAILFDLDDTIISAYGRPLVAWGKVAREFATQIAPSNPQDIATAIAAAAKTFWSDAGRHRQWRQSLSEARRLIVAEALPRHDQATTDAIADRFTRLREEEMHLFPGAMATIEELRRRGVRLALITNGDAATQRAKIERFELARHFDHIQIEGEHGFGKPEERAYRHALTAMNAAPHETWMVGDNLEWEVAAPQRLGIFAIWHDSERTGLPPDAPAKPDRIITSLPELLPR